MNGKSGFVDPSNGWEPIVVAAAQSLSPTSRAIPLRALYLAVEAECERRGRTLTTFYRDKVRQVVQRSANFEHVSKGVWRYTPGSPTPR